MKIDKTEDSLESSKFHINSNYKEFTDRQRNVFDQLGAIETTTRNILSKNDTVMEIEEPHNDINTATFLTPQNSNLRHLQGQESFFKKPQARPLKHIKTLLNRTVPDYQINPHKWTRYTLDVPQEDMSEKANVTAAMSFLRELEKRNENMQDMDEVPSKITFKKLVPKVKDEVEASISFRNSKIVMPEYVVGQKIKKSKSRNPEKRMNSGKPEIKLDHISIYDDGEED